MRNLILGLLAGLFLGANGAGAATITIWTEKATVVYEANRSISTSTGGTTEQEDWEYTSSKVWGNPKLDLFDPALGTLTRVDFYAKFDGWSSASHSNRKCLMTWGDCNKFYKSASTTGSGTIGIFDLRATYDAGWAIANDNNVSRTDSNTNRTWQWNLTEQSDLALFQGVGQVDTFTEASFTRAAYAKCIASALDLGVITKCKMDTYHRVSMTAQFVATYHYDPVASPETPAVPLPATGLLMIGALGAVALVRRRKV